MHYKNGRPAREGDKVVCLVNNNFVAGILHSTNPNANTCNGRVTPMGSNDPWVSVKDCLHLDDIAASAERLPALFNETQPVAVNPGGLIPDVVAGR